MKNTPATQYIIDAKGQKRAVIISYTDYAQLVEDFHDLKVISERKKEPTISLEKVKIKFKK